MQFTTFLALEAMHLSDAANCLLPSPNEPHDMKPSFVRIQTRAASRRACGISRSRRRSKRKCMRRRPGEPLRRSQRRLQLPSQAPQGRRSSSSRRCTQVHRSGLCVTWQLPDMCVHCQSCVTGGFGCQWGLMSTAASSLGPDLHCKAQGGCRWWDVMMLRGSPVPLTGPMYQHHPTQHCPASPETDLWRAAALSIVSAFTQSTAPAE